MSERGNERENTTLARPATEPAPKHSWELAFNEYGGYDCMFGAWEIIRDGKTLLEIDQHHYGQQPCDNSYRSEEAERVARICFEALREELA